MSLSKKYSRRDPQRTYHRRPEWVQNNYSDEYHIAPREEPRRFISQDYDERNFWPSGHDEENFASYDRESFEEDSFMDEAYAVDRFSRAVPKKRRYLGNNDINSGYGRRMNNQPNPYYSDDYYYDENENRNAYYYGDTDDYQSGYDYYESYPSYGQISEKERRFRRSDEFPQSGFEKRQRSESLRRRGARPNIRDKRY